MGDRDADACIGRVVATLLRLSRSLDPQDLDDLLGAIDVEMETAMELVLERRLRRRPEGNVVSFPDPSDRQRP